MSTNICPLCNKAYTSRPAISRTDNHTLICPDCGTREALAGLGLGEDEREKILSIIHEHTGRLMDGDDDGDEEKK